MARDVTQKTEPGVQTFIPDAAQMQARQKRAQGGNANIDFPRRFTDSRSAADDRIEQRLALMDKNGMTPFGQAYFDESVADYVLRKEQEVKAANFDAWFGREYNKADLASRRRAQELYPEYFAARLRLMKERADMALRIKTIELMGPRSEEDLALQFALNTGEIALGEGWDRIGYQNNNKDFNQEEFKRELKRRPGLYSAAKRQAHAENNNPRAFYKGDGASYDYRFGVNAVPGGSTLSKEFVKKFLKE